MNKKRLVVFASGTGTNFINIYNKINQNDVNGKIVLLVSDNSSCGAIKFAENKNIDTDIINLVRYNSEKELRARYEAILKKYNPDLILLAGFMKKIPDNVIKIYKNKIMNIHPSLLPKYGGEGYYGMNVHNAVIENKEKNTGATIHFVDKRYDRGPIIIQKHIKVNSLDTPETLSNRVLKIEHEIYPKAIKAFCANKITIKNNQIKIDE